MRSEFGVFHIIYQSDQSMREARVVHQSDHLLQVFGFGQQELKHWVALDPDQGVEDFGEMVDTVLVQIFLLSIEKVE